MTDDLGRWFNSFAHEGGKDEFDALVAVVTAREERLNERCAAYRGQVETGAQEIDRLTRELAASEDERCKMADRMMVWLRERDEAIRHRDFLMQAISDHQRNVWGDGPVGHSEDDNLYAAIGEYVTHEQKGGGR